MTDLGEPIVLVGEVPLLAQMQRHFDTLMQGYMQGKATTDFPENSQLRTILEAAIPTTLQSYMDAVRSDAWAEMQARATRVKLLLTSSAELSCSFDDAFFIDGRGKDNGRDGQGWPMMLPIHCGDVECWVELQLIEKLSKAAANENGGG